jgi:hypothetical protein
MAVSIEHPPTVISIPVNLSRRVLLRDLRDLIEALDDVPEDHYLDVFDDEIRYETAR